MDYLLKEAKAHQVLPVLELAERFQANLREFHLPRTASPRDLYQAADKAGAPRETLPVMNSLGHGYENLTLPSGDKIFSAHILTRGSVVHHTDFFNPANPNMEIALMKESIRGGRLNHRWELRGTELPETIKWTDRII